MSSSQDKIALSNELTNYGGLYNQSNVSSPMKDRYAPNTMSDSKYSENYTSEKKSQYVIDSQQRNKRISQSRIQEYGQKSEDKSMYGQSTEQATASYIAEKDREEQKFIQISKMSKEMRQDQEVAAKLNELDQASRYYMAFDMQKMQRDLNNEMDQQIGRIRQEYQNHNKEITNRIQECENLNKNSSSLKQDSVQMRIQKVKQLQDINQKSSQFDQKYEKDNKDKNQLREQLTELEKMCRELQRQIVQTNLENEGLKILLGCEKELREERNIEETNALLLVNDDLKNTNLVTEEERKKAKKQREIVESSVTNLDKQISESKGRVQELLTQIKQSKDHNQEQIQRLDGELKALLTENKQLKLQKDKQEQQVKNLEKEVQSLQQQEKQLNSGWEQQIKDIEIRLAERKEEIEEVLKETGETTQEIATLKVLAQTCSFKYEYELALKEMYDAQQYESRLRRLGGEIDNSQRKAKALEDELKKISENWVNYYEETLRQMKQRLEEMNNQANLENMEKLIAQLREKDQNLQELQFGIEELKTDVQQNKNTDNDLQRVKNECQAKIKHYRRVLNEKTILYDELFAQAKQLLNRDDLIIKNEEEIIRLKYEIDISKLEMEQKKELVSELEQRLEDDKAKYKDLKLEIKKLQKKYEALQIVLKQKEDELEQIEEILKDRDNVIEDLQKQLDYKEPPPKVQEIKYKEIYRPIKGDLVDELLAKYVNQMQCMVPIKRLGDGNYLFGTRKIYAKIMNGKLVIRVGGGFMIIEEFITAYSEQELQKIQQLIEKGMFDINEYNNNGASINNNLNESVSPTKRKGGSGSPTRN